MTASQKAVGLGLLLAMGGAGVGALLGVINGHRGRYELVQRQEVQPGLPGPAGVSGSGSGE